jgi:hypothetical protein
MDYIFINIILVLFVGTSGNFLPLGIHSHIRRTVIICKQLCYFSTIDLKRHPGGMGTLGDMCIN